MSSTAASLSRYYATMADITGEQARLERLQKATLGVPFEQQDVAQLQDIQSELKKRAEAAHSLAEVAAAFTALEHSSAPADVSTAANGLGTELSSIQQLPDASYAPTVLQNAGKILTQLAQERDERKIAKQIDPTVAALAEMFSQEKPAYESMNHTYIVLAQSIANDLVKHDQVDPGSLMSPALKPFGLASRMPAEQVPQGLKDYALEEIKSRGDAEIAAHAKASDSMESALQELQKHVHQLAADGHAPPDSQLFKLSDVESWIKLMQ